MKPTSGPGAAASAGINTLARFTTREAAARQRSRTGEGLGEPTTYSLKAWAVITLLKTARFCASPATNWSSRTTTQRRGQALDPFRERPYVSGGHGEPSSWVIIAPEPFEAEGISCVDAEIA